jgi:predicted esterase
LNGLAKAQQLLTDFLAVLEREYDWDPSRIFLLGFSQVRACVCARAKRPSTTYTAACGFRALWSRSGWR